MKQPSMAHFIIVRRHIILLSTLPILSTPCHMMMINISACTFFIKTPDRLHVINTCSETLSAGIWRTAVWHTHISTFRKILLPPPSPLRWYTYTTLHDVISQTTTFTGTIERSSDLTNQSGLTIKTVLTLNMRPVRKADNLITILCCCHEIWNP